MARDAGFGDREPSRETDGEPTDDIPFDFDFGRCSTLPAHSTPFFPPFGAAHAHCFDCFEPGSRDSEASSLTFFFSGVFARAAHCAPIDTTTKRCDLLILPSPDQQPRQPAAAHGSVSVTQPSLETSHPGIVSERSRLSLNRSRHLSGAVPARHSFSESTAVWCFKASNSSGHSRTAQDSTAQDLCLHDIPRGTSSARLVARRREPHSRDEVEASNCPSESQSSACRVWVSQETSRGSCHCSVPFPTRSFCAPRSMLYAPRQCVRGQGNRLRTINVALHRQYRVSSLAVFVLGLLLMGTPCGTCSPVADIHRGDRPLMVSLESVSETRPGMNGSLLSRSLELPAPCFPGCPGPVPLLPCHFRLSRAELTSELPRCRFPGSCVLRSNLRPRLSSAGHWPLSH